MARKFVCSEHLGKEIMSYIKVQDGDEAVIDKDDNSIVNDIKDRYLRCNAQISKEAFKIKETPLGAKYIGPFPTESVKKLIDLINGYVSRHRKKNKEGK